MSLHFADCFVEFFHVLRSFVCSCCGGFCTYMHMNCIFKVFSAVFVIIWLRAFRREM